MIARRPDLTDAALSVVLVFCATISIAKCVLGCGGLPAPTQAQGERWLGYDAELRACDSARDAGTDARESAFNECVRRRGLER